MSSTVRYNNAQNVGFCKSVLYNVHLMRLLNLFYEILAEMMPFPEIYGEQQHTCIYILESFCCYMAHCSEQSTAIIS